MKSNINKIKKGFTLVELLVVLAIIGLLAVIGIPAILNAQRNARDTARLKQATALQAAAASVSTKNNGQAVVFTVAGTNVTITSGAVASDVVAFAPYSMAIVSNATGTCTAASTGNTVSVAVNTTVGTKTITYCPEGTVVRNGEVLNY